MVACSTVPADAQSRDPWNPPVDGRSRDPFANPVQSVPPVPSRAQGYDERESWGHGPAWRGDFQLLTFKDQLYLLDARTGCTWGRSDFNSSWYLEFPVNGAGDECQRRLASARQNAINGGTR